MKRTIEIDDTLSERVQDVRNDIIDNIKEWLLEDVFIEPTPESNLSLYETWNIQAEDKCSIHEIVDSNTPIYNSEIDGLYYLHGNELDEAYENEGFGYSKENNYRQVAIYCYLLQEAYKVDLKDIFDDFEAYRNDLLANVKDKGAQRSALENYVNNIK